LVATLPPSLTAKLGCLASHQVALLIAENAEVNDEEVKIDQEQLMVQAGAEEVEPLR